MQKYIVLALAVGLTTLPGLSQVGLSPVPLWPKDGNTTPYLNHYVFLELNTGNLVVSFPSSIDPLASTVGTKTFRVNLPNKVTPHVDITSEPLPDGRFRYSYQIANGPAPSDPITNWELEVASFTSTEFLGPAGWRWKAITDIPGTENEYSSAKDHHTTWTVPLARRESQPPPQALLSFLQPAPVSFRRIFN